MVQKVMHQSIHFKPAPRQPVMHAILALANHARYDASINSPADKVANNL